MAFGGILGFLALLLLVVFTGMRLFSDDSRDAPKLPPQFGVEASTLELTDADWREISRGAVVWGAYKPGGLPSALADLLRALPATDGSSPNWDTLLLPTLNALRDAGRETEAADLEALVEAATAESETADELRRWASRVAQALRERSRPELPEIFRIDDNFSMSATEVTQEQWFAFLVARAERSKTRTPERYFPRSWRRASGDPLVPWIYPANEYAHPITDIDFVAAQEFCQWIWEEHLDADENVTVDLPTYREFARAGRGASYDNFPWGKQRDTSEAVLSDRARAVDDPAVGEHRGLRGLIGNVAEWVHYVIAADDAAFTTGCAAAGWSYASPDLAADGDRVLTPFSTPGLETEFDITDRSAHVGFRFVLRRTPARPVFVKFGAGAVRFVSRPSPVILNFIKQDLTAPFTDGVRFEPLILPEAARTVGQPFSIATTEITNRQYLTFLVALAAEQDGVEAALIPRFFGIRPHPFAGQDVVFAGPYGDPSAIPDIYEAGEENYPIQGISPEQARAYAAWLGRATRSTVRLPTAAEFIRAGRGDETKPYPWGKSTGVRELICAGRADDQDRAASLFSFLGDRPTAGLCGNVLELVDVGAGEYWLAGGCYEFPAEACTLDDFLDPAWISVRVPTESGELLIPLQPVTGFRVVREEAAR